MVIAYCRSEKYLEEEDKVEFAMFENVYKEPVFHIEDLIDDGQLYSPFEVSSDE